MPEFNSLKELEAYLNKQIASTLKNEVAETVKNVEQQQIDKTVYQEYQPSSIDGEPFRYERRRDNGGLRDRNNMIENVNVTSNGVELTVENITKGKDSGQEIAGLIEYGDGYGGQQYDYKTNRDGTAYQYLRSRPFTSNTENELRQTGKHVEAMCKGLKAKGLDVE